MNKTITLIDLLDIDAKGEKKPNKIKFEDNTYKLTDYGYEAENGDELYGLINFDGSNLNSTIEIIEDNDKSEKIEKLDDRHYDEVNKCFCGRKMLGETVLVDKINELIDYINKIEEEMRK